MELFQQYKPSASYRMLRNWDVQSQYLKERFSELTDADLKLENGKESELFSRIEAKLNKKREEVINIIIRKVRKEKV